MKLLENNRKIYDLGFGGDFFSTAPKTHSMKEIIDKLRYL